MNPHSRWEADFKSTAAELQKATNITDLFDITYAYTGWQQRYAYDELRERTKNRKTHCTGITIILDAQRVGISGFSLFWDKAHAGRTD
ncbi:hypothetical protein [Sphingomonas sp. SAFR-052]|uniref:hypothetical protein n=1 Tax=Sphingomonas sp. SAFR-052 TaxID=3436867 RepID=UPI003F81D0F6